MFVVFGEEMFVARLLSNQEVEVALLALQCEEAVEIRETQVCIHEVVEEVFLDQQVEEWSHQVTRKELRKRESGTG